MPVTGDFADTPFSDLVQLYTSTRQTVAISVHLLDGRGEDGVFYVAGGDVVDGWLGDATGRDAIRRAMRLASGSFRVEPNLAAPERTISGSWSQILIEELVRIDEERRAADGVRAADGRDPDATRVIATPSPEAGGAAARGAPAPGECGDDDPTVTGVDLALAATTGSDAGTDALAAAAASSRPAPPRPPGRRTALRAAVAAALGVVVIAGAGALHARRAAAGAAPSTPASAGRARPASSGAGGAAVSLGFVAPLSGPEKDRGRAMKVGVELALAAANELGGVYGRRLDLVALDDAGDPARAAVAVRDLADRGAVLALLGDAADPVADAAWPVARERRLPVVGALARGAHGGMVSPERYLFSHRATTEEETAAAVRYLAEVRRVAPSEIAVFAEESAFGEAGFAGAAAALRGLGRDPAGIVRVGYARGSADVSAAVERLRGAGAHVRAVVMVARHRPAARLVERVAALHPRMVFTDVSAADAGALAEELVAARVPVQGNVVVTQVVPSPTSRASAVMRYRALLSRYALGQSPDAPSLEGFVVGSLAVEALRAAGPDATPASLAEALEGLGGLDLGVGAAVGLSRADHQASHKVWGAALAAGGVWQSVDLE